MANKNRLRYNFESGTLGAQLTSGGTSITFNVAPGFSTLGTDEYIVLIIEEEILYLTNYTASSTTGTVERGKEGTSDVTHNNGTIWKHGPTRLDFGDIVSIPVGGADDDDFDRIAPATSLPSGYSWDTQDTATYREFNSWGVINDPVGSAAGYKLIHKTLPSGTPKEIIGRFKLIGGDSSKLGFLLRQSSTGELLIFVIEDINGYVTLQVHRHDDFDTFNSAITTLQELITAGLDSIWLKIIKNSDSDFDFHFSLDGDKWNNHSLALNPSAWITTNQVGWGVQDDAGTGTTGACDFIRFE